MAKKLLKILLIILGVILLCAAALILWLSVTEFKPGDVSDVKVEANSEVSGLSPFLDEEFSVISWNIGYAGLGKDSDFFMDGGPWGYIKHYIPMLTRRRSLCCRRSTKTPHELTARTRPMRWASITVPMHSTIPASSCPIRCRPSEGSTADF